MTNLFRAEQSQKQLASIETLINKRHLELEKVRAECLKEEAILIDSFEKRKRAFDTELATLQNQVLGLERRKEEALMPLTAKEQELTVRESAVSKKETELETRQEEIEAYARELSQKQEGLENMSSSLHELKVSIAPQMAEIDRREARLDKLEKDYALKEITLGQRISDQQKLEEDFAKQCIVDRKAIQAERDHVNEEKKDIISIKRQLEDQRQTLERAFSRLQNNGSTISKKGRK